MTYNEAKYKINNIKEATTDFQNSINKVEADLIAKSSDMSNINSSISNKISQVDIVDYSDQAIRDINALITETLSISASALSTLSNDATEEIRKIVDAYNSSIVDEEDKPPKPRLSYETINLSSLGSAPNTSTTLSGHHGNGGNNDSSGYNGNYGYTPSPSFQNYISRLGVEDFNSDNIDNWNSYVNEFLSTYNLSDSVESIKIDGKKIICKLKNGEEIVIENVTDINALVSKIKSNL